MEHSSSRLRIWEGWKTTLAESIPVAPFDRALLSAYSHTQAAEHLYACETLSEQCSAPPDRDGAEPYTLQWFLEIENRRHSRHGRWLPRLLEFAKHAGERL